MSLEIIQPGFLSLVQDYGRYHYQKLGLSSGGPLDEHAFLWANHLLQNTYNDAQIEITLGNFEARFHKETTIALCGADMNATLNGKAISFWQTYAVKRGDRLSLRAPSSGLRAYLAVKGGFCIEQQLTSCATVMREKLGGLKQNGSQLGRDDRLDYLAAEHAALRSVPREYIPEYKDQITLRFIPNTTITGADNKSIEAFINTFYEVGQNSNRMGYRLIGAPLKLPTAGILSQGIALGSIQVPKDGQPIILLCDRQTIGGYPLLGCVISLDLPKLAQSKPGTKVNFEVVDLELIEAEVLDHKYFFNLHF